MSRKQHGDDGAEAPRASLRPDEPNRSHPAPSIADGLREHVDRSPLAIAMVDGITHVVRYANPAFRKLSDSGAGGVLGGPLAAFVPASAADAVAAVLARVQADGEACADVEVGCEPDGRPDGQVCWCVTVWPVTRDSGHAEHLLLQVHHMSEEVRERRLRAAAADELRRVNERLVLATLREESLRESATRFRHQALHDPLTGLANRTLFLDRISHALARAERDSTSSAVLFIDLDGFKQINDTLGHAAGDQVLTATADRLRREVRAGDTVARFGGDEFAILVEGTHPAEAEAEAMEVAGRIQAAVRMPIDIDGRPHTVGASVGVTVGGSTPPDELLRRADRAMYVAKARGGNAYVLYEQGLM